jgi:hypothetical protein
MRIERGDGVLAPLSLIGLGLWLVNDHLLQPYWSGIISGKLGDVASLVVLPIALQAFVELTWGRAAYATRTLTVACCLAVGAVFFAMETTPWGSWAFRFVLGALRWPMVVLRAGELTPIALVAHVSDVEDLITLPALLVPYRLGMERARLLETSLAAGQQA